MKPLLPLAMALAAAAMTYGALSLCGNEPFRERFGPFVGCDRYPDCGYIKREGPQPPPPLNGFARGAGCGPSRMRTRPRIR